MGPIRAAASSPKSTGKCEAKKPQQCHPTITEGEAIEADCDMDESDGAREAKAVRGGVSFDHEGR